MSRALISGVPGVFSSSDLMVRVTMSCTTTGLRSTLATTAARRGRAIKARTANSSARGAIPDGAPVTVLSYRFWQEHFDGDRNVIGTFIEIARDPDEVYFGP